MNIICIPPDLDAVYEIWINKGIIKISYSIFIQKVACFINDPNRFRDFVFNISNMIRPAF